MTVTHAAAYKSGSQRAGKVTEAWGAENFYCPNCSSPKLDWLKPGTKANDYKCPSCGFWYQLKSQKTRIGGSVTDGAYGAMMEAIREDRAPNFFFLHYDLATWTVRNLLLVPHFAFPPSAIIKRKPLSANARRAGWIGCNFDLTRIPTEARIWVVRSADCPNPQHVEIGETRVSSGALVSGRALRVGTTRGPTPFVATPADVREQFRKIKPLKDVEVVQRGWTLDVLSAVQSLRTATGKKEFTTSEAYGFAPELERLHPDNRHVKDKIRQQLQVLRDMGLLVHVGRGCWRTAT